MWGTARDLSERKKTEPSCNWPPVFDNSGEGIAIADNSRVVVPANRAFSTITGYAFHELYGRPLQIHSGSANDDSYLQGMCGIHWTIPATGKANWRTATGMAAASSSG